MDEFFWKQNAKPVLVTIGVLVVFIAAVFFAYAKMAVIEKDYQNLAEKGQAIQGVLKRCDPFEGTIIWKRTGGLSAKEPGVRVAIEYSLANDKKNVLYEEWPVQHKDSCRTGDLIELLYFSANDLVKVSSKKNVQMAWRFVSGN